MKTFRYGILPFALVLMLIVGLLVLEPHISCAIIIFAVAIVMLFVGGVGWQYLLGGGALASAGIVIAAHTMDYVKNRVDVWRDPFGPQIGDPLYDAAYQIKQSLWAVGSGGFTGLGLGQGRQKYLYLPEEHNDYIFAIVCEEFGMVGGTIVILLYAWIVYRGMRVAMKCRNRYGSLMAAGISIVFGLQVFINIAVVTGLAPTTGQPLPFISAGGSSLLVFMVSMGILLNISRDVDI
jgi:cell division protein FtsW